MDLTDAAHTWRTHGFVVLPGFIPADELAPAVGELGLLFPSAEGFHDGGDPRRERFLGDEFAGIDTFPFSSVELSLLAVHPRLSRLAAALLTNQDQVQDIRLYSAEAWAKYTGAADYDQVMHRDYLNHTILVPTDAPGFQQVEMFVYLVDVPDDLGPPHLVSRTRTAGLPAKPNWYPRADVTDGESGFVSTSGSPELYEAEVSAAGPAGTVVAFQLGTFHRGTALTAARGVRYSMHLNYRPAAVEWGQRQSWADRSHEPAWYRFVQRATRRQLELFGFPPPGHAFWTPGTLAAMALRYPGLDLSPWMSPSPRSQAI
ncbi:phytanoyl-CoA dioxygenase family protein [Nonomuraea sp. NPDC002799]